MKYDNSDVRRRDRLLDEERATELLRSAEYGVLSMTGEDGKAYGVPLNFVWDGDHTIYAHCAMEGKKLRSIALRPDTSFCVVGRVSLVPGQFTTEYESIVMRCQAALVDDDDERRGALTMLVGKLDPEHLELGKKYIEKSFHRTAVLRLNVESCSGKRKYVR